MRIKTYDSANAFLSDTRAELECDEAANNLMLGLAIRASESAGSADTPSYMATVWQGARLSAAGLLTRSRPLIVFGDPSSHAIGELARALHANSWPVPGVLGPSGTAHAFAASWTACSGQTARISRLERAYQLRTVTSPTPAPGRLRAALPDDEDLVTGWIVAFSGETGVHLSAAEALEIGRSRTASGALFLWEDPRPVSMAAATRPTPRGIAVGGVYTPTEARRRGYASSCVAALSQRLLDEGKEMVVLFTDLANPTSNHIYQTIGFRPLCDYDEIAFAAP
jgi:uncharacterized protein